MILWFYELEIQFITSLKKNPKTLRFQIFFLSDFTVSCQKPPTIREPKYSEILLIFMNLSIFLVILQLCAMIYTVISHSLYLRLFIKPAMELQNNTVKCTDSVSQFYFLTG